MHNEYGIYANGEIQIGELPENMHVKGKVAWYIYKGPYSTIGSKGWDVFWVKYAKKKLKGTGAPGDVYICSPPCHKEDNQQEMLTLIWCPIE
jgi:hypothetical protein